MSILLGGLLVGLLAPSCFAQGEGTILAQEAGKSAILTADQIFNSDQEMDFRYFRLFSYLREKNSPLADYSWHLISQADYWGIDWRLLTAIAGLESDFGKKILPGTFNAYGWGGGYIAFDNWYDSIVQMSRNLKTKYYDKGLDTPLKIGPVYAPPCQHWAKTVIYLIEQI